MANHHHHRILLSPSSTPSIPPTIPPPLPPPPGPPSRTGPTSPPAPPAPTPKKRTRPVSACEACRAKKVKCLLKPDAPVCENCALSGKPCLFRVDDLAPALRAQRFADYDTSSGNARVIGTKSKGRPKSNTTTTKPTAAGPSSAASRDRPRSQGRPRQRRKTNGDTPDPGQGHLGSAEERRPAKAVFRSLANPTHLAAPSPATASVVPSQPSPSSSSSAPQPLPSRPPPLPPASPRNTDPSMMATAYPYSIPTAPSAHATPRLAPPAAAPAAAAAAAEPSSFAHRRSATVSSGSTQQQYALQSAGPLPLPAYSHAEPWQQQQQQQQQQYQSPAYRAPYAHARTSSMSAGTPGPISQTLPSFRSTFSDLEPRASEPRSVPLQPAYRGFSIYDVCDESDSRYESAQGSQAHTPRLPSARGTPRLPSPTPSVLPTRSAETSASAMPRPRLPYPAVKDYEESDQVNEQAFEGLQLPPEFGFPSRWYVSQRSASASSESASASASANQNQSTPSLPMGMGMGMPAQDVPGPSSEPIRPMQIQQQQASSRRAPPEPPRTRPPPRRTEEVDPMSPSYYGHPRADEGSPTLMQTSSSQAEAPDREHEDEHEQGQDDEQEHEQERDQGREREREQNGMETADAQARADREERFDRAKRKERELDRGVDVDVELELGREREGERKRPRDSEPEVELEGMWGRERAREREQERPRETNEKEKENENEIGEEGRDRDLMMARTREHEHEHERRPEGMSGLMREAGPSSRSASTSASAFAEGQTERQRQRQAERETETETETDAQMRIDLDHEKNLNGGFKRIALPFFRYFGVTANTPGYRRIKVGVFHDPDLDADEAPVVPAGDAPAPGDAPAFTSEREAEYGGRSVAAMAMREDGSGPNTPLASGTDEVSKTGLGSTSGSAPGTGAVPGTGAAAPMSVSIDSPRAVVGPGGESTLSTSSRDLFEPSRPRYPRKDLLEHLVPIFNSHFRTSFFPWIEEGEVGKGVREGTLPAILANGICAMTARFSSRPELKRDPIRSAGEPFSDMAKILIVPMLSWPSIEVIEALILLSYAEFGAGSDSGLWMYAGMALRMAQDLGLQHAATISSMSPQRHQDRARQLFWTVVSLDRVICFGTGRPVTIREDAIDCQLPPLDDDPNSETFVSGHIIRILLLRGRMGELLNRRDDGLRIEDRKKRLRQMYVDLAKYYQSLPNLLQFSVQTFKRAAAMNQGPAFVYLHVLFQSTISLLHRPSLMRKFTSDISKLLPEPSFAPVASTASRTIADILSLADALDDKSYLANPFLDQLILPAGRAFLAEREAARDALRRFGYTPSPSRPASRDGQQTNAGNQKINMLLVSRSWAESNLNTCLQVLEKIAVFWGGASWPTRALEQEMAGATVDPDASDEDAQNAPIRDVEMVLQWAKAKVKRAKALSSSRQRGLAEKDAQAKGLATAQAEERERGSGDALALGAGSAGGLGATGGGGGATLRSGSGSGSGTGTGKEKEKEKEKAKAKEPRTVDSSSGHGPDAASARDPSLPQHPPRPRSRPRPRPHGRDRLDSTASIRSDNSPLGLGISGLLGADADIDVEALLNSLAFEGAEGGQAYAYAYAYSSASASASGIPSGSGSANAGVNGAGAGANLGTAAAATGGNFGAETVAGQGNGYANSHQSAYSGLGLPTGTGTGTGTGTSTSTGTSSGLGWLTIPGTFAGPQPTMTNTTTTNLDNLDLGLLDNAGDVFPLDFSSFADLVGGRGAGNADAEAGGGEVAAGEGETEGNMSALLLGALQFSNAVTFDDVFGVGGGGGGGIAGAGAGGTERERGNGNANAQARGA